MYLKEIVTNGFKSFADKMNIVLNDETTCIVGPNGSGKSNIVDAVRWVLGEQSVKSLRGEGSMSDVIFAGSASRKTKNVASVELIFDNEDHYLKLDYTEVSIKRRVYRTGENEYFINNEKCRLKDIVNLFLDSGVGRESFNIIGQGEVQKILSESKDDRRMIFEEAAGILKYKKRKEEALRKLDRTHDSLDRISDIINELESQVTPLKEQSEKASEYLKAKEELEDLEIALLAFDIYNLNKEQELLHKNKESLTKEITSLTSTDTKDTTEELKEKNNLVKIEKELEYTQSELLKTTEEAGILQADLQVLKIERENDKDKDNTIDIRQLHIDQEELKKSLELKEEERKSINNHLSNYRSDIKKIEEELKRIKLEKSDSDKEYSRLDRELLTNKHKIELLKEEKDSGSSLPYVVRNILNEKSLEGIYDVIGNVVKTKDEYLRALDIALSASKNFIIVKDEVSAKSAISTLKTKNWGRATFFPLTVIEERYPDKSYLNKIKDSEGFIGVLADLVTTDEIYKKIIYNQLGLVLLCEDMDSALKISKLINKRYKVITLAGDVINVGGSMTGGTLNKRGSVITLEQEINSLKNSIELATKESNKVLENITTINNKITKKEDEIYEILKDANLLKESLTNIDKEIELLTTNLISKTKKLETLESSSEVLDSKEKSLIEEYYQKTTYKEKLEQKKKELQEDLVTLKKKIETLEEENRYKSNLLRKKEEELKKQEISLSKIDVKLDSYLFTLEQEYNLTFEKAREDYSLKEDVEISRAKVNTYRMNIKNLGMVNLAAIEEYERVRTRYEFLLHQKEDLQKAEVTLLEIMDEMDEVMKKEFLETFEAINKEFQGVFRELFHGGGASLKLTDKEDLLNTGIEIIASPPGKKLSTINLLSGGEKTLTAISLLFAILNVRCVPFCIFDEVEAALDEANVDQFGKYLENYKDKTQFLIITHKKKTMEYADTLYGITMQESGVSRLVSVKLTNKEELI